MLWKRKNNPKAIVIDAQHAVHSVLFAEDGKLVLSGGVEGMLRRWRTDDGNEAGKPVQMEETEIFTAALSPDRKWLVYGLRLLDTSSRKGNVRVWDAQTHEEVYDINSHSETVSSVDVSPDSTKFASGGADNLTFIWNIKTGEKLVGPLEHEGYVVAVRFSPQGDRLATAAAENPDSKSIRIYDVDTGEVLLDIPFSFKLSISSWLAWSADGSQIFSVSWKGQVKRFDTYSGSLLSTWSLPVSGYPTSVVLAHNQKLAVVAAYDTLSFWDTSSQQQIGTIIEHTSAVWSIALSLNDDRLATGEENGKVIVRSLRDILPAAYLTIDLPLIHISATEFKYWVRGDLTRVEELLDADIVHPFNSSYRARALAHRSLLRARSNQSVTAIEDATKSIEIQQSIIGRVAHAVALLGTGDIESAIRVFDQAVGEALSSEKNILSLIKTIILFNCGKHTDAILCLDRFIDEVHDQSPYITVRAQMHLLLGHVTLKRGENQHALELFKQAQKATPVQQGSYLQVISLIFGWDFESLATEIQQAVSTALESLGSQVLTPEMTANWHPDFIQLNHHAVARVENNGEVAEVFQNPEQAIEKHAIALSLKRSKHSELVVERSNVRAQLGLCEDASSDSDEATKADPSSPRGRKRKRAAPMKQHNAATDAFTHTHPLIEGALDKGMHRKKYVTPTRIDNVLIEVNKICPLVLIDVKSGRLCNELERSHMFKSEPQFKELLSSMTEELDERRIKQVAEEYFQYVTLSHVWKVEEPSFQDVQMVGNSVWKLNSSLQNEKLRNFCGEVARNGYRWAWSDTCCIDKTISTVLNQSLKMMYKWYEASAATYAHLADVDSPSALGALSDSLWMTRAWTSQELLSPKIIRFYTRDWKPYLGDTRSNHKESPEIMQELADTIKISRNTLVSFEPDDLSNREKLRLASRRNATREEDVAYSLIGMFKSDIRPDYGERYAALGHLLEEIVARSGDVSVLAWTGQSSPYNSCLPASLIVYSEPPATFSAIGDADLDARVAALKDQLSQTSVGPFHQRVVALPPARFANRRLHLPCIIFSVKRLALQQFGHDHEFHYRARVPGIGYLEFQTSDRLSPMEPRKLIFVHPWIRDLCDLPDGFIWGSSADDGDNSSDSGVESEGASPRSPLHVVPSPFMDDYTRALRLIARLKQPFHALLLQQQPNGEFKRVAAEHDIVISNLSEEIDFARDAGTRVVEIL